MATLLEILARDMREWPVNRKFPLRQTMEGEVYISCDDSDSGNTIYLAKFYELASDVMTAIVTKSEWEQARNKNNPGFQIVLSQNASMDSPSALRDRHIALEQEKESIKNRIIEIEQEQKELRDSLLEQGFILAECSVGQPSAPIKDVPPEEWEAGDIFLVTVPGGFSEGDEVRLIDINCQEDAWKFEYLDGHDYWWLNSSHVKFLRKGQ